jgi:hypothetical protein
VIRADRLAPSRPMYAFNPATWAKDTWGNGFNVAAVWFKRKSGVLTAFMGDYRPMVIRRDRQPAGDTYEVWITAADDNRYGGSWLASWNGTGLLSYDQPVTPDETAKRVKFLDAMLRGYPAPPAGFDGWWTFPRPAKGAGR